jgi:hypothetical protein
MKSGEIRIGIKEIMRTNMTGAKIQFPAKLSFPRSGVYD